jgi:hypothetical protein
MKNKDTKNFEGISDATSCPLSKKPIYCPTRAGDKIPLTTKFKMAQRDAKEASFWHFCVTGEQLMPFEELRVEESQGFSVPEFNSENGKERYKLILQTKKKDLERILKKMGYATIRELAMDVTLNNRYSELRTTVLELLREDRTTCMIQIEELTKRLTNIDKAVAELIH